MKKINLTYLATPYTQFPGGHQAAFNIACEAAAIFFAARIPVFSPIAHSHPIAQHLTHEHIMDHELWVAIDAPLLAACDAMVVVTVEGWRESKGIAHEIEAFDLAGKPIVYWRPGKPLPDLFTRPL